MVADRWITDWPINPKFPLLTRANAGEVLPDPCSPLGWTLTWNPPGITAGWLDSALHDYCSVLPGELSEDTPEVVGHVGGYLYINATSVRLFGVRGPGLTPEAIDRVYLGDHPDAPPYEPEPWHENDEATARVGAWMGKVMTDTDLPELRDDRDVSIGARTARPDLGALTDEQLVAHARGFIPTIRHLFRRHLAITAGSSIGPGVLGAVAEALGDPSLALTLITSVGEVDSAAPSAAMWTLSRLDPSSDEYRQGFDRFMLDFGSRGPNEWDIYSDVWETKPTLALSLIDSMRATGPDSDPAKRWDVVVADREAATREAMSIVAGNDEATAMVLAAQASAMRFNAWRERTKSNCIKAINEQRVAMLELGARHLADRRDVFILVDAELDGFVADPASFTDTIADRKATWTSLWALEPPYFVQSDLGVPQLDQLLAKSNDRAVIAVTGEVLVGSPGCAGVVRGRARIILDASDPGALEPGDILVAPNTDPAWTPLFVAAGGVVVDVGAMNSHAIIVSRELGVPCAVSVVDASKRIPDGALVELDGAAGTVTIL